MSSATRESGWWLSLRSPSFSRNARGFAMLRDPWGLALQLAKRKRAMIGQGKNLKSK